MTIKRVISTQISVSIVILLVFSMFQVAMVEAQTFNFKPKTPGLYVYQPDSNHTYLMDPFLDVFFFYAMADNLTQISFYYSLDNGSISPLSASLDYYYLYYYRVSGTVRALTDGEHTLTVWAHCSNGTVNALFSTHLNVDVAANTPVVVSPQNQTTYNTAQVPLTYTINKPILWAYYSIDSTNSSDLKHFDGNITLPNLSEGQHRLTLAVTTNQTTIHQTVQTIVFTVNNSTPSSTVPELPNITSLIIAVAIVSLSVILGKRKLKTQNVRQPFTL